MAKDNLTAVLYGINDLRMEQTPIEEPNDDDDFRFVRKLNAQGISVSVGHPRSETYKISDHVASRDNWMMGIFFDTRCQSQETNEEIFAQATEHGLYKGIHNWLVIGSNLEETREILNDTAYNCMTDFVLAIESNYSYDLYDVYNLCKDSGGILNITEMAFWDSTNGLNVTLRQDKFSRRSNFHGIEVKVASVIKYRQSGVSIEDHLQDNTRKWEDPVSKFGYTILRHVADMFNFTIVVKECEEWAVVKNGTEEGMMPAVSRAQVDIIGTPASPTERWMSYGSLSMPGYPWRTFFVLRSDFKKLKWTELVTPFASDSWFATILTAILAILIISVLQMSEYGEGWSTELGHAIFAMIGVICQQGLTFVPNRIAGRIALLFLLFFGVMLLNYYGASVVSARLNEPSDKMNDSLYSLAKSQMKVASEPLYVIDDNLNTRSRVEWEVRFFNEKIWKKLGLSRFVPVEDGLSQVAKGGYAYHTSAEVAYPYIEKNWDEKAICDMTEIHVLTPRVLHYYQRVDSPFEEFMRIGLMKTADMGLRRRMVKYWQPKTPYCSPEARSLQSISFFDVAPAIMMLLIGVAVALVVHQVERFMMKMFPTTLTVLEAPKMQRTGGKKAIMRL